jgi:hypothetical protein
MTNQHIFMGVLIFITVFLTLGFIEKTVFGIIAEYMNRTEINGSRLIFKKVEQHEKGRLYLTFLVPLLWTIIYFYHQYLNR